MQIGELAPTRRKGESVLLVAACLFALLLLASPGIARAQTLDREIRAEVARYVRAVNQGDPAALGTLYLNDPRTGSLGNGTMTRGWPAVAALLEDFFGQVGSVRMSVDSITVMPLGADAALAYFRYRWLLGADTSATETGAMTLVFRRVNGRWMVAHDHASTLPAETEDAAAGAPSGPVRATTPCLVARIIDGDTIECAGIGRVRLIGMDAPETNQGRFATMTTAALARMAPPGSTVDLELDVEPRDRYGRTLAYLWAGGRLLNWEMVRQGWAVIATYPPNVQYVDAFRAAQDAAQAGAVGLWAINGFDCLPGDRRAGRCD